MNTYTVGETVELEARFTDENGAPVNPADVTGTIRDPDGTVTALVVENPNIGEFVSKFTPAKNGLHEYRFAAVPSPLGAAVEGNFIAQTVFPA